MAKKSKSYRTEEPKPRSLLREGVNAVRRAVLPTAVRRSIAGDCTRCRMHIADARILLIHRIEGVTGWSFPVRFVGHRIFGDNLNIGRHEIVERLRRFLLVECVLRD